MKTLFIIFATTFSVKANAQLLESPNKDGMIDNIKTVSPQTLKANFSGAKYLFNTDKGKVYALPLDNMPCLVPDESLMLKEQKNFKQVFPPNTIPNPYPKIPLIPDSTRRISIYKNLPQNY